MARPLETTLEPGDAPESRPVPAPAPTSDGAPRPEVRRRAEAYLATLTSVPVPLRDRLRYWVYYLALAHRGTQVYSPTHDAVYEDGFLKRGYEKVLERINRRLEARPEPGPEVEVPAFENDELTAADYRFLMRLNIPFLIRNGSEGLPVREWTLDYIEEVAGDCEVPINEAPDRPEEDLSRPSKSFHYYDFHRGKLREVTAAIRAGGNARISTAEDVMFHDDGRLRRDLGIERWERISGWEVNQHHWLRGRLFAGKVVSAQLLMQPENAFTLWHLEPGDNFFVLSKGVKTWWLAHPLYTAAFRPRVKTSTNYTGTNIDVREDDEVLASRGYGAYLKVPKTKVTVRPGDVLRVPNHWWHTAVTHAGSYTLAATIRADTMPNRVGPGYFLLRKLDPQYHQIVRDYIQDGRIHDRHIGFPRRTRGAAADAESATGS